MRLSGSETELSNRCPPELWDSRLFVLQIRFDRRRSIRRKVPDRPTTNRPSARRRMDQKATRAELRAGQSLERLESLGMSSDRVYRVVYPEDRGHLLQFPPALRALLRPMVAIARPVHSLCRLSIRTREGIVQISDRQQTFAVGTCGRTEQWALGKGIGSAR
jgi:hypothetical protein